MKLPFIKFFPTDWLAEPSLRACSVAARGLWIDMLSMMHLAPRRGYLLAATGSPISPVQLARMTGCAADEVTQLLAELCTSGAFSCTDDGTIYSRRMVRDESKRELCSAAGRKGGGNPTFKGGPKGASKGGPKGGSKPLEARSQKPEHPPNPPPGGGAAFESFWQEYPRKTARQSAARAWEKLSPDEALQRVILDALRRQKRSDQWLRDGDRFIPHAATWLNGRRWEDQLGPAEPAESDVERIAREAAERARRTQDEIAARRRERQEGATP